MKFAAILLMTMNLWGSIICCCQNLVCSTDDVISCGTMETAEQPAQPSCHSAPKESVPIENSCHSSKTSSSETPATGNQETMIGTAQSAFHQTCQCSNHGVMDLSFTVPSPTSHEVVMWQTIDITSWLAVLQQGGPFAVTDAPTQASAMPAQALGLSMLSRFLI